MREALALMLALPLLSSCTLTPGGNFKVIEATKVPFSAVPEPQGLANAGDTVWKVSLDGGGDWARTVRSQEMNGYPIVARCDDRNATLYAVGPYVGSVRIAQGAPGFAALDAAKDTLRYDIYLPVTGRYHSTADFNAPMPSYDLRKERIELCIKLGGGAMTGIGARSNEVRVTIGGA